MYLENYFFLILKNRKVCNENSSSIRQLNSSQSSFAVMGCAPTKAHPNNTNHRRSPSVSQRRSPSVSLRSKESLQKPDANDIRIVRIKHKRSLTHGGERAVPTVRVEILANGQKFHIDVKRQDSLDVPSQTNHARRAGTDESNKRLHPPSNKHYNRSPSFQDELDRNLQEFKRAQAKFKSHEFKSRTRQPPAPTRRVQSAIN